MFISVADSDKRAVILPAHRLQELGFRLVATEGTAEILARNGIAVEVVNKYSATQESGETNIVDLINAGEIDIVVNTPSGGIGARRRLRDPRGGGRRRQGAVHDDGGARRRRERAAGAARGLPRQEPAGVRRSIGRRARDGAFGERAARRASPSFGPLCVGIDPHAHLLERVGAGCLGRRRCASSGCAWSRPPPAGSASSSRRSSFFERYGSAGFAALEDVLAAARAAGLLVIADAKRGDIGSTMDALRRGLARRRVAARGGCR